MTKKSVIFVNLGSPLKPTFSSIARYLSEFLSDPLVVQLPRIIWLGLLHFVIIPIRSFKIISKYQSVWIEKKKIANQPHYLEYGSPLHYFSKNFLNKIKSLNQNPNLEFGLAMRYGQPSIKKVLEDMLSKNCSNFLIFPLYPQYSNSTTKSVINKFSNQLDQLSANHNLAYINWDLIRSYHEQDFYIKSLVVKIKDHWQQQAKAQKIIISFHSLPQKMIDQGDPYQDQCFQTAKCLQTQLGLKDDDLIVSFQSRFGRSKWIEPSTIEILQDLPKNGVKSIDIVCPGFSVDCLETLEEVNMMFRKAFIDGGGEVFNYINCLNDDDVWVRNIYEYIKQTS